MMKKNIIIILILVFCLNILNNLGHPVTPSFVRSLDIPEYMFGIFYATMSLGMVIASPFWGSLGDSIKNKYLIFIGIIIYAIGQLGFGFVHNQYLMVLFRFISGMGVAAPMILFVSSLIGHSDNDKIRNLAILAALTTLGSSLGYQIGGRLGDSQVFRRLINTPSYENIFLFQALAFVIFGLVVLFLLKDYEKNNLAVKRKNPFSTLSKIKTLDLKIILFLVSLTLITMGSTNLSKYIDVYFNDLGLSTTSLGNFVLVTGFVSVAASALIVPFVSKLKRQLLFIIITQIISALIVFYVFRANNFILSIYTVYNVYIIIKAVFLPLEQNYISRQVDRDSIGTITGIRQSFVSIGNVIGPLLGGLLYSIKPLLLFDISGTLFLMGAFLLSIVLLMEKRIKEI